MDAGPNSIIELVTGSFQEPQQPRHEDDHSSPSIADDKSGTILLLLYAFVA